MSELQCLNYNIWTAKPEEIQSELDLYAKKQYPAYIPAALIDRLSASRVASEAGEPFFFLILDKSPEWSACVRVCGADHPEAWAFAAYHSNKSSGLPDMCDW